jgi:DNA-binding response OmpR family regulator
MSHKILVVEDELDMLNVVKDVLTAAGHTVFTCSTGNDAMDIFREKKPDVVVLDWQLPGKDGLEILQ